MRSVSISRLDWPGPRDISVEAQSFSQQAHPAAFVQHSYPIEAALKHERFVDSPSNEVKGENDDMQQDADPTRSRISHLVAIQKDETHQCSVSTTMVKVTPRMAVDMPSTAV